MCIIIILSLIHKDLAVKNLVQTWDVGTCYSRFSCDSIQYLMVFSYDSIHNPKIFIHEADIVLCLIFSDNLQIMSHYLKRIVVFGSCAPVTMFLLQQAKEFCAKWLELGNLMPWEGNQHFSSGLW